ncbi:MAG: hypothetical protein JWP87_4337 [Labilithrix sp.]|nr:hypothetical protein [Labilithrix sp.]
MASPIPPHALSRRTVDELTIEDERSFRHVGLYADLKEVLRRAKYPFRVLPTALSGRADRALLLNLTFWGPDSGGDVLESDTLPADVVAHAAWHHLAAKALPSAAGGAPSVDSLFLGESIASAFDVYLVGRLLGHAPSSTFLESQVPAMADTADAAGLDEDGFEAMLESIARDPERAFGDLRELLFDATSSLFACGSVEEASAALAKHDDHRFASLLHRFELSNWVLYARAYGDAQPDARARSIDAKLRSEKLSLEWLAREWVTPAIA